MEENNQNQNINAEDIKKEAKETVNQVKDSFKNVDVKQETEKAKNFFSGILTAPVKTMNNIANDSSNSFLKTAIVLIVVWVLLSGINKVIGIVRTIISLGFRYVKFSDFASIVTVAITPLIIIAVMAGITYFLHSKQNKKSFVTVFNTITAAFLPFVVIKVLNVLTTLVSIITIGISKITSPIICILQIASIILLFFGIKGLSGEDDETAVKKFIIIQAIYCGIAFILGFLTFGIYLV